MSGISHLLAVARAYAEVEGVPLSTVSSRCFDDGKRLSMVEAGADLRSRSLERAMQWFSDKWPPGVDWPSDVPRPAPSAEVAA